MNLDNLKTIEQIEDFLNGSQTIAFAIATNKDDSCYFISYPLMCRDALRLALSLIFVQLTHVLAVIYFVPYAYFVVKALSRSDTLQVEWYRFDLAISDETQKNKAQPKLESRGE